MPRTLSSHTPHPRSRYWRQLAIVTALVLLAHWALLVGAPNFTISATDTESQPNRAFTTRTIATEAPPAASNALPAKAPPAAISSTKRVSQASNAIASSNNFIEPVTTPSPPQPQEEDDAPDRAPEATAAPEPSATPAATALGYAIPGSVRLKYDIKGEVKGFPYFANGELLWLQDGSSYDARLEISHFLLGARVQTSKGQLTAQGLEPTRFGDKVRSEVAAHFERSKNKVSFSANTPDAPLQPGAQDQLSIFMQLAAMFGASADRFPEGSRIAFQAVGARSAESWEFTVGATEVQTLPGGPVTAVQLTRQPTGEYDPRVEVWLAPAMGFVPVRIRLVQSNGDFVEQQWRATQKP